MTVPELHAEGERLLETAGTHREWVEEWHGQLDRWHAEVFREISAECRDLDPDIGVIQGLAMLAELIEAREPIRWYS